MFNFLGKLAFVIIVFYLLSYTSFFKDHAENIKQAFYEKIGNVMAEVDRVSEKVNETKDKIDETKEKIDKTKEAVANAADKIKETADTIEKAADAINSFSDDDPKEEVDSESTE